MTSTWQVMTFLAYKCTTCWFLLLCLGSSGSWNLVYSTLFADGLSYLCIYRNWSKVEAIGISSTEFINIPPATSNAKISLRKEGSSEALYLPKSACYILSLQFQRGHFLSNAHSNYFNKLMFKSIISWMFAFAIISSMFLFLLQLYQPSFGFNLNDPYCKLMETTYKSLHDPHLKSYFKRKDILKKLKQGGYITSNNKVRWGLLLTNKSLGIF